jgi:2-polyprenyl-3-methyl-5-hydroxy-6-metoxy-1,4-benzoquinol methylase
MMPRAGMNAIDREPGAAREPLEELVAESAQRGAAFPRCAVLIVASTVSREQLAATLERIPCGLVPLLSEIAVLCEDTATEDDARTGFDADRSHWRNGRVLRNPRRYGYGGRRKVAFEYALSQPFDYIVVLDADGRDPPEALSALFARGVLERRPLVLFAAASTRGSGLVAAAHNRILGTAVSDWSSGLRLFATDLLRRVPYQLNADDRRFDTEILIQCRAIGVPISEVTLAGSPASSHAPAEPFAPWRSLACAIDYRLHQLHLTRRGRYLVDETFYTLKRSPTGSHMQIVAAVRPGSRALDLGCSQGLLAEPLRAKGVRVTGVDTATQHPVSPHLDAYHSRDLELPLELPEGRVFDYVVVSDVIEHVRNRMQLLRSVRRYLKPEGRLLISTGNVAIWFYRLSLLAGRFEYGKRGILDETHVHLFTRASFRREVERGGFQVLAERMTALPFEVVFQSTGRSRLVRMLARAYHLLARAWPELFAYQFLLEAEVTTLLDDDTSRVAALGGSAA